MQQAALVLALTASAVLAVVGLPARADMPARVISAELAPWSRSADPLRDFAERLTGELLPSGASADAQMACALVRGPGALGCFERALDAHRGDSAWISRTLRRAVREAEEPAVIREAALGLEAQRDFRNTGLLLWAVLTDRGGAALAPDLFRCWHRLEHVWVRQYGAFAALLAENPSTRALLATYSLTRYGKRLESIQGRLEALSAAAPASDDALTRLVVSPLTRERTALWLRRFGRMTPPRASNDVPDVDVPALNTVPDFTGFDPWLDQPAWYPDRVHLTIDDGPRPEITGPLLKTLGHYGVKATFFFVGAPIARHYVDDPDGITRLVAAVLDAGHRIGFHSLDHELDFPHHVKGWAADQVADSAALFRTMLRLVVGRAVPVFHMRYPGGTAAFDQKTRETLLVAGMNQHVFWTMGPEFWTQRTPPHTLVKRACKLAKELRPSVVLIHEFPTLPADLRVILGTIQSKCPSAEAPSGPTRTRFIRREIPSEEK